MDDYIGLDRSMKETVVSIRRGGKRVWRGKCPSDPELIADLIRKRAPSVKRVVFETGPLSVWFYLTRSTGIAPCQMVDLIHRLCWLSILALLDFKPALRREFLLRQGQPRRRDQFAIKRRILQPLSASCPPSLQRSGGRFKVCSMRCSQPA